MTSISTPNYAIHFNANGYIKLNKFIVDSNFSKLFILVDSNTKDNCLSYFLKQLITNLNIEIIEIRPGEPFKNIDTCKEVWNKLSDYDADRKSLLINLGGGVVTDLGGFVASTFKRGMKYINIPTSLLAMVDASVGGKTGVDLGVLKNQIGLINFSEMVVIDSHYLNTLPQAEINSGMAEMFKHGLISSEAYWQKMVKVTANDFASFDQLIFDSICIKNDIVKIDPNEEGLRKTLNYGHTLGHAIESYCLSDNNIETLLHGEAIAIGMILATYISHVIYDFPKDKLNEITRVLKNNYKHMSFSRKDITKIIDLLKFDKKNTHGDINFVLLKDIAQPRLDCAVSNTLIFEAFNFYSSEKN
jgi:3-dehydroquinate synthase